MFHNCRALLVTGSDNDYNATLPKVQNTSLSKIQLPLLSLFVLFVFNYCWIILAA